MRRLYIRLPRPIEVVEIDVEVFKGFALGFSIERSEYDMPQFILVVGPFGVSFTFGYPF